MKFEIDPSPSPATFTDTTVTWMLEDSDGKTTNNLSRTTGAFSRHYDGYKRNGMPEYPHSTTTYECEVNQKKF